MNNTDYEGLLALETKGGALMRALRPLEGRRAVRRAHAAIRRQLRAHADNEGISFELGSVSATEAGIDLNGTVYDMFKPMKEALKAYKGDEISLRIHSDGGSAFEGSALYNLLRSDGRPVTTTAIGIAASAASLVFMAGDNRIVAPGAVLMIHDVWSCGIGNAAELRQMAEELDVASDAIAELYAERAAGTVAEWREHMAADTYLGGDDAVEMGLATGRETPVAKPRKKDDAAKDKAMGDDDDDEMNGKRKRAQAVASPSLFAWDGSLIRTT